jgi:hypothetical protein
MSIDFIENIVVILAFFAFGFGLLFLSPNILALNPYAGIIVAIIGLAFIFGSLKMSVKLLQNP